MPARRPVNTAVASTMADPASRLSTAALSIRGGEHAAAATQGVEQLECCAVGVGESATSYATGDGASSWYLITRGRR